MTSLSPLPPASSEPVLNWFDIAPKDAQHLDLSVRLDISAPISDSGERSPWPWEPQQLVGAPLGMYHCPYCGSMVVAGVPHGDYAEVLNGDGPRDD